MCFKNVRKYLKFNHRHLLMISLVLYSIKYVLMYYLIKAERQLPHKLPVHNIVSSVDSRDAEETAISLTSSKF